MRNAHRMFWVGMLLVSTCAGVFAQPPAPKVEKSHKYRTILTVGGGGGGFALGLFTGLSVFDDSINSDRKLWTTAALSAVGGAVGGYFLGRSLDKRQDRAKITRESDRFYETLLQSAAPFSGPAGSFGLRTRADLRTSPAANPSSTASEDFLSTEPAFPASSDLNRLYLGVALQRIEPIK
jgi:hypothetical protein